MKMLGKEANNVYLKPLSSTMMYVPPRGIIAGMATDYPPCLERSLTTGNLS